MTIFIAVIFPVFLNETVSTKVDIIQRDLGISLISNRSSTNFTPWNNIYSPLFRLFNKHTGFSFDDVVLDELLDQINITIYDYDGRALEPDDVSV